MDHRKSSDPSGSCPGSAMRQWDTRQDAGASEKTEVPMSRLGQWPVQLMLVPPDAPYFKDADLLIVADCVPFAYGNFHQDFLQDRAIVVGCPKLDDLQFYVEKLTEVFSANTLRSVEVIVMEVPCCGGLVQATHTALYKAGSTTPLKVTTIGVRGEHLGARTL